MARLRIEFLGTRTVISLKGAVTTVGRSNRCTICLPDKKLANIHFRIEEKSRGFRLKDDGSGIGTFVNGKPVFATTLRHGDVIEAAGLRCTFLTEREARTPPGIPVAMPADEPLRHNVARIALVTGAVIVFAGVVAFLMTRESADDRADAAWRQAREVLDREWRDPAQARADLTEAIPLLEECSKTGANVSRTAKMRLAEVRRLLVAFTRIDAERKLVSATRLDDDAELALRGRLGQFRRLQHAAIDQEIDSVEQALEERQKAHLEARYAQAEKDSRAHFIAERYAPAAAAWRDLDVADYFMRKRIEAARMDVVKRTSSAYRARLRLAGRSGDLDARIHLLEACRKIFAGTRHADDLEVRISALRSRRMRTNVVVLDAKDTSKTATPPEKTPDKPVEAGPYQDPPKVISLIKARRYAEAAQTLHSITRHPDALVRAEELTLLANLMADLVARVNATPGEFRKILLPNRVGRGDATGADQKFIKIQKDGSRTQYAWDSLPSKSFVKLFRQAGFHKPPRLGVAIFFDEALLPKNAQSVWVSFFKSEQAPTTLTRILARRRGIKAPPGGFILFRGQLVTPTERESIELSELVSRLGRQARSKNPRRRTRAWDELEKLGEPALETLVLAVKERRRLAGGELAASRAFKPGNFVARFGRELEKRRKHALAFIMDARAYPYPNKTPSAQKEAERRVDAVRELYETPFDELLESSDAAQLLNKEVQDLDKKLAQLDPLSEPIHETVVESITNKLDMRMVAVDEGDRRRIEYNVAIEKYNRDLEGTSVDSEERANTKAVNEYRWMMGRASVKIDERLVRASRKHSIEMQQLKYFAHDSPTGHLKSPSMRGKREGYGGGVAENIARGASSGRGAFKQWFGSSGHHRNMLSGHTEMGCGAAAHHWWTQNFGRLTGKSLTPPRVPKDPDPPGTSGNGMPPPAN